MQKLMVWFDYVDAKKIIIKHTRTEEEKLVSFDD
jgi:hypothetical protein